MLNNIFKVADKICIIGAGGFGREVLCLLIDCLALKKINYKERVLFMESDDYWKKRKVMGIDVIAQSQFNPSEYKVVVAIGDPSTRQQMVNNLPKNTVYNTLIHPSVIYSEWLSIGEGSIICAGSILTCNITIGNHAQLNLHTTIGHDCIIGNYFTAGPSVNASGNCTIGNNVYIGTNAAIREKTNICSDVTIGMGAVVIKNITESGVYIGNPLKKLVKKNSAE